MDRLAEHYAAQSIAVYPLESSDVPPKQIVAYLGTTGIDITLFELAASKLGLCALLLSVNNSPAAVAHLCKITNSTHLIYHPKFAATSTEAAKILSTEGIHLTLVPETRFPLWGAGGLKETIDQIRPFRARLTPEQEHLRPGVILHSSGSTGFPKPIFITHKGLIANASANFGYPGFSTQPTFHGNGHFAVFRSWYAKKALLIFPPYLPLTAHNIVETLRAYPTGGQCYTVPYVLKLMGEDEDAIAELCKFEMITFSGAPLPDELGDRLTSRGASIVAHYGTTETGGLLTSHREFKSDKGWNWLRAEGAVVPYLRFEERGSSTYELVVEDGWPAKIESNRPDKAYATKDLFIIHPDHKNWYKSVGRLDDTLVQVLGEKTNPVPIENAIRGNNPYVKEGEPDLWTG